MEPLNTLETTPMIQQRSIEWFEQRLGKFTSSELHKLMKSGRSKTERFSETAKTYILEKVAEVITGAPKQATGAALEWGIYQEIYAKEVYENTYGKVEDCGFFEYNEVFGGSPDGVLEGGIIEIKCPFDTTNHIKNCLAKTPEELKEHSEEYYFQIQGNLLASGAGFCDFISYDPRCSERFKMHVIRVFRDDEVINQIIERLHEASKVMNEYLKRLTGI